MLIVSRRALQNKHTADEILSITWLFIKYVQINWFKNSDRDELELRLRLAVGQCRQCRSNQSEAHTRYICIKIQLNNESGQQQQTNKQKKLKQASQGIWNTFFLVTKEAERSLLNSTV